MSKYSIGQSGNPKGRPKGIPDKRVALRALLEPHAAKLVQKVIAKALKGKGDTTALRICLDRLIPTVKPRNETVRFPTSGGTLADDIRGDGVLTGGSLVDQADLASILSRCPVLADVPGSPPTDGEDDDHHEPMQKENANDFTKGTRSV